MTSSTRRQKRRREIAENPKNVRFEALKALLESYGFALNRTRSSHHTFVGMVGVEKVTIVVPFRKPVHTVYVKRILAILDRIEPLAPQSADNEEANPDETA